MGLVVFALRNEGNVVGIGGKLDGSALANDGSEIVVRSKRVVLRKIRREGENFSGIAKARKIGMLKLGVVAPCPAAVDVDEETSV